MGKFCLGLIRYDEYSDYFMGYMNMVSEGVSLVANRELLIRGLVLG